MLTVVQRAREAAVEIDGDEVASIGPGLLVLLGVSAEDADADADYLAAKVAHLRIFRDGDRPMDRSLLETGNEALVVSQFTLYGDCRKGRRPDFARAAGAGEARRLYELFVARLRALGVPTRTGVFGAMMQVSLVNDGPVTLLLSSPSEYEEPRKR